MAVPGSVTLLADLSEKPLVNSVELTVGITGKAVCVGPGVGVGPEGVDVATDGVGVLVLGARALLAEACMTLTTRMINTSAKIIVT